MLSYNGARGNQIESPFPAGASRNVDKCEAALGAHPRLMGRYLQPVKIFRERNLPDRRDKLELRIFENIKLVWKLIQTPVPRVSCTSKNIIIRVNLIGLLLIEKFTRRRRE